MSKGKRLVTAAAAGFSAALLGSTALAGEGGGTYTLVIENDWMFNQDRDYSSGVRLDYVSGESAPGNGWTGKIARHVLGADGASMVRTGISLNHLMFTPDDTSGPAAPVGQQPYAGYLGGQYTVYEQRGDTLEQINFAVGVIGPEAQAEQLQDAFHEIFDDDEAQGWDSQLDTELALAVTYDKAVKVARAEGPMGFGGDVIVHGGGTLGTTLTQANVGGAVRFGKDLGDDFLPVRMFPYAGAGFWDNTSLASAYVFAGVEARAVARNVFLDGSTFSDSPSLDKEALVGDWFVGAAAQVWVGQLTFAYYEKGKEYETQEVPQKIGSINFSFNF